MNTKQIPSQCSPPVQQLNAEEYTILCRFRQFYQCFVNQKNINPEKDLQAKKMWELFEQNLISGRNLQQKKQKINQKFNTQKKYKYSQRLSKSVNKSRINQKHILNKHHSFQKLQNLKLSTWKTSLYQDIKWIKQILTHGHKFIKS